MRTNFSSRIGQQCPQYADLAKYFHGKISETVKHLFTSFALPIWKSVFGMSAEFAFILPNNYSWNQFIKVWWVWRGLSSFMSLLLNHFIETTESSANLSAKSLYLSRSSRPEVFCKTGVLRNFAKFTGKHLRQSLLFNKVASLRLATLLKKKLWHRSFPVNFAKILRTPFLTEHLWWLLLYEVNAWEVL